LRNNSFDKNWKQTNFNKVIKIIYLVPSLKLSNEAILLEMDPFKSLLILVAYFLLQIGITI